MKRAAVVLAVAFLPAALFQRRRPNRGAWGRRCLVGGACFGWAASLWSCFAVGAALTPGCRSRHARQRTLRRLPGRACLPVSGALLFGLPLDGFCLRNAAFPARCTLRERRARLSGTRGRDAMRTQTNKKFRLLMLSTPRRSGILPMLVGRRAQSERVRPTEIKILFVASGC